MTKPTSIKKRDKIHVFLLAPILAVVFIVGWILYFIGQTNQSKTKQPQRPINKTSRDQNEIELFVIPKEEQILAN